MNTIKMGYVIALGQNIQFLTKDLEWQEGELTPEFFHTESATYATAVSLKKMHTLARGDIRLPECIYPALLLGNEWTINAHPIPFEKIEGYLKNKETH